MKIIEITEALARLNQDGETEIAKAAGLELEDLQAENARLRELLAETLVTLKRMTTDEFSKGADKAIREKIENELELS